RPDARHPRGREGVLFRNHTGVRLAAPELSREVGQIDDTCAWPGLPRPCSSQAASSRPPAHLVDRRARTVHVLADQRKALLLVEADSPGIVGVDVEAEPPRPRP